MMMKAKSEDHKLSHEEGLRLKQNSSQLIRWVNFYRVREAKPETRQMRERLENQIMRLDYLTRFEMYSLLLKEACVQVERGIKECNQYDDVRGFYNRFLTKGI
jgi:hypothetical protein